MAGISEPDSVYPLARLCRLRPQQLLRPWPLKTGRDVFTERNGGQERIRTFEGVSQQIYSLPRLTASVPTLKAGAQGIRRGVLALKPKISGLIKTLRPCIMR